MASSASPFRGGASSLGWTQQPSYDSQNNSNNILASPILRFYQKKENVLPLSSAFLLHNHERTPVFDSVKDSQLKERSRAQSGWRRSVQENIEG